LVTTRYFGIGLESSAVRAGTEAAAARKVRLSISLVTISNPKLSPLKLNSVV
jgi:hypothetical protein